jgi:hypothetical protein
MADVVVTGAVGAEPLTSLASWKEALRALRKGDDTQVDALYPRVLKTIEWYYNQFNDVDREEFVSQRGWKEIMEQLASGKGIQLLGNIISKLVKRLLSKPSTVARGLNVLVQLAGISGHLSMNLLDLYTGMAKQFGFKLVVENGVEAYRGAPAVALFTFVVAANDDNEITIRLGNQTGGAIGDTDTLQRALEQLRVRRAALDRQRAQLVQQSGPANYQAQASSDRYSTAATSGLRSGYFQPGRPPTAYPGALKRQRVMPVAQPADLSAARTAFAQDTQPMLQARTAVAAVENQIRQVDRRIAQAEARLRRTEKTAAQGLLDLSQSGGGVSLQELLNRAHAPVKAQRRKVAPASHRGASAGQTSYALSGRPPPLPGFHEMSDGTLMRD